MRRWITVSLCLLILAIPVVAANQNSPRIPLGSAYQTLHANTAGSAYVADSGLLNNGNQVSIGAALSSTDRLLVAPSAAAENGVRVNMPPGSTGNGLEIDSAGTAETTIDSGGNINTQGGYSVGGSTVASANVYGVNGASLTITKGIATAYTSAAVTVIPSAANYTITSTKGGLYIAPPGTYTITLPAASSIGAKNYTIKVSGVLSSSQTITLGAASGSTWMENGGASMAITNVSYPCRVFSATGSTYFLISPTS